MVDVTAPEENNHRTPTAPGHQLEDPPRAATVRATPAEAVAVLVPTTAGAAAAGAHHMVLAGEQVAAVIAEADATQIATSPASHMTAMMPAT
jgi:hypothetical protein